jgi:hypothetical protein
MPNSGVQLTSNRVMDSQREIAALFLATNGGVSGAVARS